MWMSASLVVTSFIIIGMMFFFLIYIANTVVTGLGLISKAVELRRDAELSKPMLRVQSAKCLSNYVEVNLSNVGSSSTFIDRSTTVIIEYLVNGSSEHVVEVLRYGESWFITGYYIGSKFYQNSNDFVELKPGMVVVINMLPSKTPSTDNPILLVITTANGERVEYIFTPN